LVATYCNIAANFVGQSYYPQPLLLREDVTELNRYARDNDDSLPCFKRFKSDPLFMGDDWNKHPTKATLFGMPVVAAGVIINTMFDWLVIVETLWATWEFLHHKFQKRIGPFK
jgi:hypothetical protein